MNRLAKLSGLARWPDAAGVGPQARSQFIGQRVADKSPRRSLGPQRGIPYVLPVVSVLVSHPRPQPFTGVRGRLPGLVTDAGGQW